MTVSRMREKLKHVPKYDNVTWHKKVTDMHDAQVIAIFHKFKKDGLFDKPKTARGEKLEKYYQMTIFDYISEPSKGE